MASWGDIKAAVEKNDGVKTFTMGDLRDANGSAKLGVNVLEEIKKKLAGIGLGHVPEDLPNYQDQQVRVYKKGTPVGDLIDMVLQTGPLNDSKLVSQAGGAAVDHAAIIEKIRELVAE